MHICVENVLWNFATLSVQRFFTNLIQIFVSWMSVLNIKTVCVASVMRSASTGTGVS